MKSSEKSSDPVLSAAAIQCLERAVAGREPLAELQMDPAAYLKREGFPLPDGAYVEIFTRETEGERPIPKFEPTATRRAALCQSGCP